MLQAELTRTLQPHQNKHQQQKQQQRKKLNNI